MRLPGMRNERRTSGDLPLAIVVLTVAAAAAWFARDIHAASVGPDFDPGPRMFPLLLAFVLGFWGLVSLIHCLLPGGGAVSPGDVDDKIASDSPIDTTPEDIPGGMPVASALAMTAVLLIYLPAISWIGFGLSTAALGTGLISWLDIRQRGKEASPGGWWLRLPTAAGTSLLLVIAVRLLFVMLFKVQLPTGALGLPF